MKPDPLFGFMVPRQVAGVPRNLLDPRAPWKDPVAYDEQAKKLAAMFRKNFEPYSSGTPRGVEEAGPSTTPRQPVGAGAQ